MRFSLHHPDRRFRAALWLLLLLALCRPARAQDPFLPLLSAEECSSYADCIPQDGNLFYAPTDWRWTWMPKGFLYHTYWASTAETRLGTQLVSEHQLGTLLDSSVGGRMGFFRYGPRDRLEGWQLDVLGGAKLRQNVEQEWDVDAVDFRVDVPLTYRLGVHGFKVGYYHVSSHLGDEFLLRNPGYDRLNFVRDVLDVGYSFYPTDRLRLYADIGWGFNTDVSEPWEFQFGFEYGPTAPTKIYGEPFVALNVHLRQEVDFGGNIALQAGWAWRGDSISSGTLRTGLFVYDGKSPQFSFYNLYERQVGVGIWYDF
ncbi:DUF1207 domain-containing protein [Planctomicrobium sp. SH664]|uniref:DUF1207 domain-containing protein n=1 Tax=Planctomicrobium sp. SH664 TaxID=3448125 RepID=UPI003F5B86F9